jgi:hypothetical protein
MPLFADYPLAGDRIVLIAHVARRNGMMVLTLDKQFQHLSVESVLLGVGENGSLQVDTSTKVNTINTNDTLNKKPGT